MLPLNVFSVSQLNFFLYIIIFLFNCLKFLTDLGLDNGHHEDYFFN